jgi:putative PIN family toxin of toxin-antitoxin system
MIQVVIDTNVLVAAIRSRLGASYALLQKLGDPRWRLNLTASVVFEYEAVLKRHCHEVGISESEIDELLDAICSGAGLHRIYFSWRPVAGDPNDDLILEAAIASRSEFIITFNWRDFSASEQFGIRCLTPKEFLILMKELP